MREHLKRIYICSYTLITFMLVIIYKMMITTCVHELQFFSILTNCYGRNINFRYFKQLFFSCSLIMYFKSYCSDDDIHSHSFVLEDNYQDQILVVLFYVVEIVVGFLQNVEYYFQHLFLMVY